METAARLTWNSRAISRGRFPAFAPQHVKSAHRVEVLTAVAPGDKGPPVPVQSSATGGHNRRFVPAGQRQTAPAAIAAFPGLGRARDDAAPPRRRNGCPERARHTTPSIMHRSAHRSRQSPGAMSRHRRPIPDTSARDETRRGSGGRRPGTADSCSRDSPPVALPSPARRGLRWMYSNNRYRYSGSLITKLLNRPWKRWSIR